MSARMDDGLIGKIKASTRLSAIIQASVPLKKSGKDFVACCPFHKEKTPSFTVNDEKGFYHCFGCSAHGDVFDWLRLTGGMELAQAVDHLAGTQPNPNVAKKTEAKWEPIVPVPAGAPRADLSGATSIHEYCSADGELLFYILRKETPKGKTFSPLVYGRMDGALGWHSKSVPSPRPLYGLDRLASLPGDPIVCEGEKAADAAQRMFPGRPCLTWPNGANSVDKADWSPLASRNVTIWPDNDENGAVAAEAITANLHRVGARVEVVRVDDLPPKADAADVNLDDPNAWLAGRITVPVQNEPPPPASEDDYGETAKVVDLTGKPVVETPAALKPRSDIRFTWFNEIEPSLDAADFVQGLLIEQSAGVVYGASNSGKTFWTTDLALHVAAGMEWNNRRVEQGGVLYAALEGGIGFRNRVSAWREERGVQGYDLPFVAITNPINLRDPEADLEGLIAALADIQDRMEVPLKLIIVDTLSRAMAGGNENAPEDMGALVMCMDRLRAETKAMVLFIHHSGKDAAKGARGHSLLQAAIDTEIEVAVDEDGSHSATVVKQRELRKGDVFSFSLNVVELGKNRHGEAVTTCLIEHGGIGAKGGKGSLSGDAKRAFEILVRLINTQGKAGEKGIPPNCSSVPDMWWRERFYSEAKPGAEEDAKRKAFGRAADKLVELGRVGMHAKRVWIPERTTNATP